MSSVYPYKLMTDALVYSALFSDTPPYLVLNTGTLHARKGCSLLPMCVLLW